MAHAQKPDFVFRRNGRVHLYLRWRQFNRLLAAEVCASALVGSNAGYTMFRGSEKSTGYPLHSPVSPSLPLPCVTVCHHHISTGLYLLISIMNFKPYYIKFSFIRLLLLYIPTYRFLQKQKSKMLTNLMVWNSGLIQKSYCV